MWTTHIHSGLHLIFKHPFKALLDPTELSSGTFRATRICTWNFRHGILYIDTDTYLKAFHLWNYRLTEDHVTIMLVYVQKRTRVNTFYVLIILTNILFDDWIVSMMRDRTWTQSSNISRVELCAWEPTGGRLCVLLMAFSSHAGDNFSYTLRSSS